MEPVAVILFIVVVTIVLSIALISISIKHKWQENIEQFNIRSPEITAMHLKQVRWNDCGYGYRVEDREKPFYKTMTIFFAGSYYALYRGEFLEKDVRYLAKRLPLGKEKELDEGHKVKAYLEFGRVMELFINKDNHEIKWARDGAPYRYYLYKNRKFE